MLLVDNSHKILVEYDDDEADDNDDGHDED